MSHRGIFRPLLTRKVVTIMCAYTIPVLRFLAFSALVDISYSPLYHLAGRPVRIFITVWVWQPQAFRLPLASVHSTYLKTSATSLLAFEITSRHINQCRLRICRNLRGKTPLFPFWYLPQSFCPTPHTVLLLTPLRSR